MYIKIFYQGINTNMNKNTYRKKYVVTNNTPNVKSYLLFSIALKDIQLNKKY
jgi:hypothetical protein